MGDGPPPKDFDYGEKLPDGQYENHPTKDEGEYVQPLRDSYVHEKCGATTTMGEKLAKSFARDPNQYVKTFCAGCGGYFTLDEYHWEGTDQPLDVVGGDNDD